MRQSGLTHRVSKPCRGGIVRFARRGFTLVEMMIAVALVLLMISLFAEIFSIATGSMTRQKGLAENDQRARMVATLMTSDFRKRTFRDVKPFVPTAAGAVPNPDETAGYLSYSENQPDDDTDDVLRLTINTQRTQQDLERDVYLLFGRATELNPLGANPNQPEGDDGNFGVANQSGQSTAAEVVWFLRNGNLYRRMVLIRKPYRSDVVGGVTGDPTTGNPPSAAPTIAGPNYTYGSGNFYSDFDYSAIFNTQLNRTQFHDYDSLRPEAGVGSGGNYNLGLGFPVPRSLGIPHLRFGHSLTIANGSPREHTNTGAFIGAFTQEETSNAAFQYPGRATAGMNDPFTRNLTIDPTTGAVVEYQSGTRMGEDLLLSNVLSMDIKIWDEAAGNGPDGQPGYAGVDDDGDGATDNTTERGSVVPATGGTDRSSPSDDGDWVDLGHSVTTGYYFRAPGDSNGNNTAYGNRFDTWSGVSALAAPPYQAMRFVPAGGRAATNFPYRVRARWQPGTNYNVGDIVLPNGSLGPFPANPYAFRCIFAGTSGAVEPGWTNANDYAVFEENAAAPPIVPPLGPFWQAIPNLVPVKALRIQVRYLDISSGLVKDLTLIHSLRDVL